ncbi:MAG: hypothetical protein QM687_12630 [Ferruginibacter sp.]
MNELKRYDQAIADQLEHLPMPPEDIAWNEMQKLLDESDDDPVVVPFFRRWGCWLPALIALLLLSTAGWFVYTKMNRPRETTAGQSTSSSVTDGKTTSSDTGTLYQSGLQVGEEIKPVAGDSINHPGSSLGDKYANDSTGGSLQQATVAGRSAMNIRNSATYTDENQPGNGKKSYSKAGPGRTKKSGKGKFNASTKAPGMEEDDQEEESPALANNKKSMTLKDDQRQSIRVESSIADSTDKPITDTGSVVKKQIPEKKKDTTSSVADSSSEKEKKHRWTWAAGLSLYQPLYINGESSVPFNQYGRKNLVTDYIPSVYLRLYRDKKWFIHSEFRYAAPQAVKGFEYKKELIDSAGMQLRTNIYQLKKTYYHQVPLSFNYYVLPGLSIGAGVIYNRLTGAVANLDKYMRISAVTDTLLSSEIINDKNDGRFVKNNFQWSAQAEYNWKRLFLGLRYSRDIKPYINYIDPEMGIGKNKYAQAFNIYLRYELWRSRKK